ncbi:uncharacterized protein LOC134258956 [Saccostrea cucullata]|uniref:uncharacterized protein LOC134258956 n=1 Tax=Saccostrea cuccullata TaxID=36930 RepID=UPI002ED1A1D7
MNTPFSSSPASQRTALQEIDMLERIRQVKNFTWIQCDNVNCQKWRKIPSMEGESLEDIEWFCHMNSDPEYNSCEAAEEDYTAYDRLAKKLGFKYVMSCLSVGTLVWAKTSGYCRWPAIITNDPEYDFHYEVDRDGDPFRYHVEYLGGVHCHAWIPANKVTLYGHKEEIQQEQGTSQVKNLRKTKKKRKKRLRLAMQIKCSKLENYRKSSVMEAIQEADLLIPLTSQERINNACKFKGNNQKQRIRKNQSDDAEDEKSKSALGLKKQTCHCESEQTKRDIFKGKHKPTSERQHKRLKDLSQSQSYDKESRGEDSKDPWLKREVERENSNSVKPITHFPLPLRTDVNTILSPSCKSVFNFDDLEMKSSMLNQSKEERFTINVQQYKRNEKAFEHDLHSFMMRHDLTIKRKVIWSNTPVGLFQLFMAVHERGGYEKVCANMLWSAVYREMTDSSAKGQCGYRAKLFYQKNIYPYELYIKGKDYQEVIRSIKGGRRIGETKKKSVKSDEAEESVQIGLDKLNQYDKESKQMLPPEKSYDLDHMLQELHSNSNKIFQLQDEIEGAQSHLGIKIKFHEDSTCTSVSDRVFEACGGSEFGNASLPVPASQCVPNVHFTSSESDQSQDMLHELQALENEFDELDKEINSLIEESCL